MSIKSLHCCVMVHSCSKFDEADTPSEEAGLEYDSSDEDLLNAETVNNNA